MLTAIMNAKLYALFSLISLEKTAFVVEKIKETADQF